MQLKEKKVKIVRPKRLIVKNGRTDFHSFNMHQHDDGHLIFYFHSCGHQSFPSSRSLNRSSLISWKRWAPREREGMIDRMMKRKCKTESVTRDQKESVWAWFALKSQLKAVTLVNTLFFLLITSVTFGLINNRDNFNLRPTILFLIDCDQLKKKENVCQWRLSCYTVVDGEPAAVS
jgi:hypothetical protein